MREQLARKRSGLIETATKKAGTLVGDIANEMFICKAVREYISSGAITPTPNNELSVAIRSQPT